MSLRVWPAATQLRGQSREVLLTLELLALPALHPTSRHRDVLSGSSGKTSPSLGPQKELGVEGPV